LKKKLAKLPSCEDITTGLCHKNEFGVPAIMHKY